MLESRSIVEILILIWIIDKNKYRSKICHVLIDTYNRLSIHYFIWLYITLVETDFELWIRYTTITGKFRNPDRRFSVGMAKEQQDVERGTTDSRLPERVVTEPLIEKDGRSTEGSISFSLLSTAVAVFGSFQYGLCVSNCKLPIWIVHAQILRPVCLSRSIEVVLPWFFLWRLQIGYTSPTQSGIINELNLSLSEVNPRLFKKIIWLQKLPLNFKKLRISIQWSRSYPPSVVFVLYVFIYQLLIDSENINTYPRLPEGLRAHPTETFGKLPWPTYYFGIW